MPFFSFTDISAQASASGSTRNGQLLPEDGVIDTIFRYNNTIIDVDKNITVRPSGSLDLFNVTILFNRSSHPNVRFRVEDGGKLILNSCRFIQMGEDEGYEGLEIYSNDIEINNCNFSGISKGLSLTNVENVNITNNIFFQNKIDVELTNCENVTFFGCDFINNNELVMNIADSGHVEEIDIINCTIISKYIDESKNEFSLINSRLHVINLLYNRDINKSFELDENSNLTLFLYLNILTTNEKNKNLKHVDITIFPEVGSWQINLTTDETGHVYWIPIPIKQFHGKNNITNLNPFILQAKKKGYSDVTLNFILWSTNSTPRLIKLKDEEKDDEFDLESTLLMVCTCFLVVILVFIILMSINVRIMRKRAKAAGLYGIDSESEGAKGSMFDSKNLITCSSCGAQVTKDVEFCPHCGEYFEGEEITCPGCKSVVRENDTSCPKCGRIFESDKKEKEKIKTKTSKTEKEDQKEKLEIPEEPEPEEGKLYCSECGGVIKESEGRCPGCGLPFEPNIDVESEKHARKITVTEEKVSEQKKELESMKNKPEHDVYMCSMCGAEIYEDSDSCPKCGTKFE
jgi:predicted amidophosphoribosyltransferase